MIASASACWISTRRKAHKPGADPMLSLARDTIGAAGVCLAANCRFQPCDRKADTVEVTALNHWGSGHGRSVDYGLKE
ncbi:hypothetical protein SAMN06265374_4234 [Roseibium denhamense]|uniref:Uncharacterized protein n=1 Tax=Roseibium denhamense TaxID=76305 RepID=A0ABY1PL78_9HYPH|nr:hypothetical protein SAMN06265374_4234 [Roseibium denhamense]